MWCGKVGPGLSGKSLGGVQCASFRSEVGRGGLHKEVTQLQKPNKNVRGIVKKAPGFCPPIKEGGKAKLCDAALKGLVIDRMCSSGWGGAAGWGLGQAAGRNQKGKKENHCP